MADPVDRRVTEWATSVHPGLTCTLAPPAAKNAGRGVSLYLMDVLHTPAHVTAKPSPLQLMLRYLVTAWAETPEDAHQLLADLAFSAQTFSEFQIETEPLPAMLWTAFGVPPVPAFLLRVPLRQARTEVPPKLVRQRLQISTTTMVQFHGLVLGPDDTPIPDSRVDIPAMALSASADYRGRFLFSSVPSQGAKTLRVRAKGRELTIRCEGSFPDKEDPFVIHFTPLEN
jgi:hypothetical protein